MKTKFLTILPLILFSFFTNVYSQEVKVTEITDNLDELFTNEENSYSDVVESSVQAYFEGLTKLYYFEIEYNNKVIFREGIKKNIPQSQDSELMSNIFRFEYSYIYLNANLIEDADKLKLLESYYSDIIDFAGKKVLALKKYEIIMKDYDKGKYVVNDLLENMKIKVYKIEF